jgi:hypothetical protein
VKPRVRWLPLLLLAGVASLHAEPATERYAPAQLRAGHDLLERARAAAARGDGGLAGRLAWQAGLDARLAWGMTESPQLRADAADLGGAAASLIHRLAAQGR